MDRVNRRTPRVRAAARPTGDSGAATISERSRDGTALRLPVAEPLDHLLVGGPARRLLGHRGLTRSAAAQQPGEAAVGLLPGRRPPGDDLRLGAGERDVGEADVVAGGLLPAEGLDRRGSRSGGRRCRGSARRPRW